MGLKHETAWLIGLNLKHDNEGGGVTYLCEQKHGNCMTMEGNCSTSWMGVKF